MSGIADGHSGNGSLSGNLILWDKISIPLNFPINVSRAGEQVTLSSSQPVSFDLEQVLGSELRKLTFDTMLAAGCAHQPGIQNKVDITLHKVVLNTN